VLFHCKAETITDDVYPGSIGNLASAVTVAASSFKMVVTDPQSLLDLINPDPLDKLLGRDPRTSQRRDPVYVEPSETDNAHEYSKAEVNNSEVHAPEAR
jgi:hypothetical protein